MKLRINAAKRLVITLLVYAAISALSFFIAYEIRFDFSVLDVHQDHRWQLIGIAVGIKLVALGLASQIGSAIAFFGVTDFLRIAFALFISAILLFIPRPLGLAEFSAPRGVILIDFLVCLSAFCSMRLGARLYRERVIVGRRMPERRMQRIVIVGAGDTGASLVSDLLNMPARGLRPVAFLDDDQFKHGKLIHGVPVLGSPDAFGMFRELQTVRCAIIAMPSAPKKRISQIALTMSRLGIQVETVPALEDLASGRARVSNLRPIEIHDLLGVPRWNWIVAPLGAL